MEEFKRSYPRWIFYILLLLFGFILGILTLYMLEYTGTTTLIQRESESEPTDIEEETDTDLEAEEISELASFTGDYVTANLPEDWSIVEYTDNTGSDILIDGVIYSGLVGLKIFNENDVEMFYIKAVDGIGGVLGCSEVYEFADSSTNYLAHGNDLANEVGTIPTSTVDLTTSSYSELSVLGWDVRRVGSTLYRNMQDSEPGFNPACGIDKYLSISSLGYTGTVAGDSYEWGISDTAVSTQLDILDDVLESLAGI
jgi:hypothetical protein